MSQLAVFKSLLQSRVDALSSKETAVNERLDWRGNPTVIIQDSNEKGDWAKTITLPPMVVKWRPELDNKGNFGHEFAKTEDQAKFRIVVTPDGVDSHFMDPDTMNAAVKGLQDFSDATRSLQRKVYKTMLLSDKLLKKQSAEFISMWEKIQGCGKGKVDINDEMLDAWCGKAMSNFIKEDTEYSMEAKSRVFDKDGNVRVVPVYNRLGCQLNAEDNTQAHINQGDLVSLRVRLNTYMLPTGMFGTSLQLMSVTLLRRGKKRKRTTHDPVGALEIFAESDNEDESDQ